jgi:hypothetical protein
LDFLNEPGATLKCPFQLFLQMPKPHITRTFASIHFEDLEPHRFEDLIRQLIYDYKDWQVSRPLEKAAATMALT